MTLRSILWLSATLLAATGCEVDTGTAPTSDWISYGGDPGGMRYAALDQINRANVGQLELAWSYRTREDEKVPPKFFTFHSLHATPLLTPVEAGQSLVFCTDFNRIIALDPVTGAERWIFDPDIEIERFGQYKCRGVSIWHDAEAEPGDACEWRVYTSTSDRRLFAVDVTNGERCAGFGDHGEVDINPLIKATVPEGDIKTVQFWAPPAVVGDIVAVSATVHSKGRLVRSYPGLVRGFDARTGKMRWWFDPVPRNPGDAEAENWTADGLANTGSASTWSYMSVDAERDLLFLPTSDASPDYYGGTRPGDNRYATSLVVLQGATGKLVWHFQFTHHDVWNYDPAAQPMLAEVTRDGAVQAVAVQVTKAGMVWVFDRETGEPVFGVEERPVPTDGVPGEVLSPTQPFPLAPPPLSPTVISPDDAWGLDDADREFCREAIASRRHGSIYEPPTLGGTILYPQPGGGVNWGGGAFDPERNLLITNISRQADYIRLIPEAELDMKKATGPGAGRPGGIPGFIEGTGYGVQIGPLASPSGVLCTAPPWSTLVAVDLADGTVSWEVPLGATDQYADRGAPLIEGILAMGGPIVTAGGLIFIGATADEKFRAFDIDTGEVLWEVKTPSASMAIPMSYAIDGRQYVVTASGGHQFFYRENLTDYILAFALPE
jgi:quinoprotein glucose dehydrogenase